MKFLGNLLKFLLWCLLAFILLAGLTALAWWMRWPMFTGVFVVAGLAGVLLLFFVGRFLWRLRSKRHFVQTALAGLETAVPLETARTPPLETRWNALLLHDRSRGGKFIDPRDFIERAWYVALDATGALSPLFAGNRTHWDASQLIARYDFSKTTLLHCQAAALGGPEGPENREELLTLMARDLKRGALSGIVLLVSAQDLLSRGEQSLREEGYALRAHLYELMAALNRNLPVVALAEGLDRLPGGDDLFARAGVAENWQGRFFAGSILRPGQDAAAAAEAAWRERLYDDLVSGPPPARDELACLDRIRALGEKLDTLFASLLEEAPRRDSLVLSGVFFCPSGTSAADPAPAAGCRRAGKRADGGKMYGTEGIVTAFVNTEAAPFLRFRADGITAAAWDGRPFPFTEDFLAFLHRSEEWAMITFSSAMTERNVLMRSSPPVVNVDAKSRPNSVTFTLFCTDGNRQIVNRNYPRSERFLFDKTKCGGVDIAVAFPSFEITRRYRSFVAFLEDFQYGEKDFVPRDFPEAQGMLEEANVKILKLRLIPDGAGELLREESGKVPLVPELITYVRE
jgi:hypothetical protein